MDQSEFQDQQRNVAERQRELEKRSSAYEIRNPSFNDMNLQRQIEAGINDWVAEGKDGHPFFGQSKAEAENIRRQYEGGAA
jgi:hypothetical protein